MKTRNKALLLSLCAVLLVTASVLGTMAYLTSTDEVTNTFTVGKVEITLDEADVDLYGAKDSEARVTKNEYKLIPNHTYTKDPTVTVKAGSEKSYVRLIVTINEQKDLDAIFAAINEKITDENKKIGISDVFGEVSKKWELISETENDNDTRTYVFYYKDIVDARDTEKDVVLEALFKTITIPSGITGDQLATLTDDPDTESVEPSLEIKVVAHAIQADGFESAEEAWATWK